MRSPLFSLLLLTWGSMLLAASPPWAERRDLTPLEGASVRVPALDLAKLKAEDAINDRKAGRYRYAVPFAVQAPALGAKNGGVVDTLPDGRLLWRYRVVAEGAKTVDLGFKSFYLPAGAELWVRAEHSKAAWGPYTDQHNNPQGEFWTPALPGDRVLVEVALPPRFRDAVQLDLVTVHSGYRGFEVVDGQLQPVPKQTGCMVDTICAEGNAWRDQIRSVARFQVSGFLCTGSLINNTAQDGAPLLLTANHCFETQAEASTVVLWYRYESPNCRAVGSANNESTVPLSVATATQSGTTLLMTHRPTDTTLVRLNQPVPAAAQGYFAGWDRREQTLPSAVGIHHPLGREKRITFENDAVGSPTVQVIIPGAPRDIVLPAGAAWRVNSWDLGSTLGGSSGSALFSPQRRIVGVLSGGSAACGTVNEPDFYGRVLAAWEGGGTPASRLRDHLDPQNSGAQFLDGRDNASCTAPTVAINPSANPATVGADVTLTAAISGGQAPYTLTWDVEGDGVADRSVSGSNSLVVRYGRTQNLTVALTVRDAAGCQTTVQRALSIVGPDVRASFGTATQLCGDGDAVFEPGERWRVPVTLTNSGSGATDGAAVAQFNKALGSSGGSANLSAPDAFGYRYSDSTTAGCGFQFVDLAGFQQATPFTLTQSPSSPNALGANDDGFARVNLPADGQFEYYGQTVSAVTLSTNGYIATSTQADGGDFEGGCGAQPARDNFGLRLRPMHTDLITGAIRGLVFATCPRPADVGPANQRCTIFQWNNAGLFTVSGQPLGNFDMQVIAYPQSRQLVFQYRNDLNSQTVSRAAVGLQNPPAGIANNYQCNNPRLISGRAVCWFHPGNLPGASASGRLEDLRLETPARVIGALGAGQSSVQNVDFSIAAGAQCGASYQLGYAGTVDPRGYHGQPTQVGFTVGTSGNCQVATQCAAAGNAIPDWRQGAYFNPGRSANGLIGSLIPVSGQPPVFFGAWYTGERNRNPIWYIVQGSLQDGQVVAPIARFRRNNNMSGSIADPTVVGTAQVSLLAREVIAFTYQFNDGSFGGDLMGHLLTGLPAANPNRSGAWFNPNESGWGYTVDSFVQGTAQDFVAFYLYDASNEPRWLVAQGGATVNPLEAVGFQVHCPTCAWMDAGPTARSAGQFSRSYASASSGTVTTNFGFPAPLSGTWLRNNAPVQLLTPVQNP